jgi:hypothetical protein
MSCREKDQPMASSACGGGLGHRSTNGAWPDNSSAFRWLERVAIVATIHSLCNRAVGVAIVISIGALGPKAYRKVELPRPKRHRPKSATARTVAPKNKRLRRIIAPPLAPVGRSHLLQPGGRLKHSRGYSRGYSTRGVPRAPSGRRRGGRRCARASGTRRARTRPTRRSRRAARPAEGSAPHRDVWA